MHPDYFRTRFRVDLTSVDWPDNFAIISAYATTGENWEASRNNAADRALEEELREKSVWIARIVGYSPDTGHEEPSWAANLSLDIGCALGERFKQDAIYYVVGDKLSVVKCNGTESAEVGSFREKIN